MCTCLGVSSSFGFHSNFQATIKTRRTPPNSSTDPAKVLSSADPSSFLLSQNKHSSKRNRSDFLSERTKKLLRLSQNQLRSFSVQQPAEVVELEECVFVTCLLKQYPVLDTTSKMVSFDFLLLLFNIFHCK